MLLHIFFFHSGEQGEERWRPAEGTVGPPRGVPARQPARAVSRPLPPKQRPTRPYVCVRRACLITCRVPARLPALLALLARRVVVSPPLAPVFACARGDASTRSMLLGGAESRHGSCIFNQLVGKAKSLKSVKKMLPCAFVWYVLM